VSVFASLTSAQRDLVLLPVAWSSMNASFTNWRTDRINTLFCRNDKNEVDGCVQTQSKSLMKCAINHTNQHRRFKDACKI